LTLSGYFRRALLVSLTNPKAILFFIAFFPLFLKPNPSTATLPLMMLHVTILTLCYQDVVVLVVLLRVGRAVRAIDRGLRIEPGGGVGGFGFGGRRGHRRRGDPVRGPASSVPRVPCAETGAATHIAAAPVLDAGRHGHNSKGTGQALGVAPITRRARSKSARPSVTLVPQ
jgi:hypothetical protein